MSPAAFLASSEDRGRHDVPSFVLLDTRSYIAGRANASTATSKTSNDLPIQVTFCAVPPPDLSYLFVHCPGLEVEPTDLILAPRVISTDADLILLRVHRDPMARMFPSRSDYFVYKINPHQSRLDLLPNPYPDRFNDNELAILSCGDRYVVATLQIMPLRSFMLHLYRSGRDGKPGSWISQQVFVEEPQRDRVCPIPKSAQSLMYHQTTKVITLGGGKGTVGWVDLWRGILLCDVLDDSPKLHDIPLPLPAKGNWDKFLNECPYYCRDITVSQSKDTIKYVEMEITQPTKVTSADSTSDVVDSYYEWLSRQERPCSYWVPGRWKATTWSMAIPITSWVPGSWHRQCTICSEDIDLPAVNTKHYELLSKLMSSSDNKGKVTEATLSLGCLHMAYPTLSVADDDDVVYFLSKGTSIRSVQMGVAVDMRTGTLQGVAKLDTKRHFGFLRCCLASGISQHLKATGICGNQQVEGRGKLQYDDVSTITAASA
ncbi:unnamed protein product [Urochloa decumbens]